MLEISKGSSKIPARVSKNQKVLIYEQIYESTNKGMNKQMYAHTKKQLKLFT